MKQTLNLGNGPNFHSIIIVSAVIHLILISVATVPLKTREDEYKSYFVNLVGPMEGHNNMNRPTSPASEKRGPAGSNDQTPEIKKTGVSLESAAAVSKEIERIRVLSALSKKKMKRDTEKAREIEILKQTLHDGITAKGPMSPAGTVQQSGIYDSYYTMLYRKIWGEWIYPESGAEGLEVVVAIKIDRTGKIISQEIEKTSGNTLFDRSAIKAISKASPLPPPPSELEIGVRFHL